MRVRIRRTMSRSPHNFQVRFAASGMPCGSRAEPKTTFGNPHGMHENARDPRPNAARGIPRGPTYICNACNLVGTEEQELWGRVALLDLCRGHANLHWGI